MKKMKKMIALLLAMVMVLAMGSLTAFAAGEPTTGKITIKNSEKGTQYDFYRLFDLKLHNLDTNQSDYESYTYTLNDKWKDFFVNGSGKDYLVSDNTGDLNSINVNGTIKYINITDSNVVGFTNAAMQYVLDRPVDQQIGSDIQATGTGADLEVVVENLGYYLMIPVNASIKTEYSSGSIASLTSTVPNVDINVKAKKPSITKIDDQVTVDVGQTVTYTITGTVPNTAGAVNYVYKISDEMTSGLTFQKDVAIKIGSKIITTDDGVAIDYTTVNNAFTATIPVKNYQDLVGETITLTYTAIVNDNAVTHKQEKNKATLEYGHKPGQTEKSIPVAEEVYTAKITVNKYTGNDTEDETKKLAGAKFALINSVGKFYKYTAATESTPAKVEWIELSDGPEANNTGAVTDSMINVIKTAAKNNNITVYTTDDDGVAEFKGIADGDYYLVEYEAPEGYNRLQKATKVEVNGQDVDTTETENIAQAGQEKFDEAINATANVQNMTGPQLPATGGMGTKLFYVLGTILVLGAGVLLITKRRMSK